MLLLLLGVQFALELVAFGGDGVQVFLERLHSFLRHVDL